MPPVPATATTQDVEPSDAFDVYRHGLALALRGRCPFCAELALDGGLVAGRHCATCGGRPADPRLREVLLQEYRARSREHVALIMGGAGLAALAAGWVPLLGIVPVVIGLVLFRVIVVSPALHLVSRRRRLVSRWTLRMMTAAALTAGGAFMTIIATLPGVNAVGGAIATVVLLGTVWWGGRSYLIAQLDRERDGTPIAAFEWVLLFSALGLLVIFTTTLVAAIALMWTALEWAWAWLGGL